MSPTVLVLQHVCQECWSCPEVTPWINTELKAALFSVVSGHLLSPVRPNRFIAGTPRCANLSWISWWSQQTRRRVLCWLHGTRGVPHSEETWPACNLSVLFLSSHQKLWDEFGLVEWFHVRSAVCIVKLQCFPAGIRSPNTGFAILSNDDLAKLFAIRRLLQMSRASVRETSKQQQGWDVIA